MLEQVERRLVAGFRFLATVTHQVRVGEDQLAQRLVKLFSCDEQPLLGHSAKAAELQCPLDFDASGGQPPERLGPAHQIVGVQVGEIQSVSRFRLPSTLLKPPPPTAKVLSPKSKLLASNITRSQDGP